MAYFDPEEMDCGDIPVDAQGEVASLIGDGTHTDELATGLADP